jgi:hypothetical protein
LSTLKSESKHAEVVGLDLNTTNEFKGGKSDWADGPNDTHPPNHDSDDSGSGLESAEEFGK